MIRADRVNPEQVPTLRILSLGAGVQSTTLALMACAGLLADLNAAIFADTGWEPPAVYEQVDRLEYQLNLVGIPLYRVSSGNIRDDLVDPRHRYASIPYFVRNPDGSDGMGRRQCTAEYKLSPIMRKCRELLGAKSPDYRRVPRGRVVEQWIGFSTDEIHRVNNRYDDLYTTKRYPLIELGMTRKDCQRWLERHGWGHTTKSACIGCPLHGNAQWRDLRDNHPEQWADAVEMDRLIRNGGAHALPSPGAAYLHRSRVPLDQAPIDRWTRKERAIIANLSIIVGTRPSVTVDTGHGMHAYWPVSDGYVFGGDIGPARALLKRWARLVDMVADSLGVSVDNVFDLSRVLRVPGTFNCKNTNGEGPLPVTAYADSGGPLTFAEIDERLTEHGVEQQDGDDAPAAQEVSPPADWVWAEKTCPYVAKMIDNWTKDAPSPGAARHPWFVSQHIRLACAHRLGCISEADHQRALHTLATRLTEVVRTTEPRREPAKFEVRDMRKYGIRTAASKTDEQARAELGGRAAGHRHDVAGDEIDDDVSAFKFADGHRPTDVGNANRLLHHAGGRIRYVHAWGKWIVYRQGRWIVDEKDALVTQIAKQVAKGLYQLAAKAAAINPDEAKPIWAWALKSDTSGAIAAMIRLARGVPGLLVNHEDLDADPWLLNVANGTVDLRTGKLRPHDPADLCTLQAPVAYHEDALAPLWEGCLQVWQPETDVRDYIQLRAGAGATGIPTETVDVDYGGGGNGKSKFHGAIQYVLGPYATVPHKSLLVAGRFEQHATVIADLFRKRLAVAAETKAAEALDDEQVKNLTGGDRLKGRRMREDPWEFWPTHTLVMFSNHKPAVRGRDEGIWRRLHLVPWTATIPEEVKDGGLALKLQAESAGILRWIVEGARRFHDAGVRLDPPKAVRAATAAYRQDEDVVGRFICEVLEIGNPLFDWCHSVDIKKELDDWCAEQDIDPPPAMNEITATLQEMGCERGGRKQVFGKRSTVWRGVSIARQSE